MATKSHLTGMGLLLVDVMDEMIRSHDIHLYCRINLIQQYVSKISAMTESRDDMRAEDRDSLEDCLDDIYEMRGAYNSMIDNDPDTPQEIRADFDRSLDDIVLETDKIVFRYDLLTLSAMRSRQGSKYGSEAALMEEEG